MTAWTTGVHYHIDGWAYIFIPPKAEIFYLADHMERFEQPPQETEREVQNPAGFKVRKKIEKKHENP